MDESAFSTELLAEIRAELKRLAVDGRIACPAALGLARRFSVPSSLIGTLADQLAIRISRCQLGCF